MNPLKEPRSFSSTEELRKVLHTQGCRMCDLGFQTNINGCCVARGPNNSKKMIVGEAPGKEEDSRREPFTGPAGELLDKIWGAAGMTTEDWYITNVVLCRPVAPWQSKKQNVTPKIEQRKRCKSYLDEQIDLLQPKIIVAIGRPATEELLGLRNIRMGDYRGKPLNAHVGKHWGALIFPMIHPAAILHARGTEKYDIYRQHTWNDVRKLTQILKEKNI